MKKLLLFGLIFNVSSLLQAEELAPKTNSPYYPYNPSYPVMGYALPYDSPSASLQARLYMLSSSIFRGEASDNGERSTISANTNRYLENFIIADSSKSFPREEFNKLTTLFTGSDTKTVLPRRLNEISRRLSDIQYQESTEESKKETAALLKEAKTLYLEVETIVKNNEELLQTSLMAQVAALPEAQLLPGYGGMLGGGMGMGAHMGGGMMGAGVGVMGAYGLPYQAYPVGSTANEANFQREIMRLRYLERLSAEMNEELRRAQLEFENQRAQRELEERFLKGYKGQ